MNAQFGGQDRKNEKRKDIKIQRRRVKGQKK
jgi:hypothetical protein